MALTYAITEDFIEMKDLKKSGIVVDLSETGRVKIQQYLVRATRYIQRHTRRDFFPWRETRQFAIPYAYYDLAVRRFPTAHLQLDQDLIEVFSLNNGQEDLSPNFYYPIDTNIRPHYAIAIKFPKYWGGAFGGVSGLRRFDEPTISIDALWGYTENTGGYRYPDDFWIDTLYALESDLNDTSTIINITTPTDRFDEIGENPFAAGRLLRIEDEYLEIIAVENSTNTVTVRRGARGSTAGSHLANTPVQRWKVIEDITEACLQIAKIWREADISAGSRIGVSDVSPGAELSIPSDPLTIIKSYARSMLLE